MRIIDKNNDFYDYLQNVYRDDSITFDRTDSFVLSKDELCYRLTCIDSRWNRKVCVGESNFVLIQVCNTFWLFLVEVTDVSKDNHVKNYSPELIATWKNYRKPRTLIQFDFIDFPWKVSKMLYAERKNWDWKNDKLIYDKSLVIKKIDTLIDLIGINDYRVDDSIKEYRVLQAGNKRVEKHIPILIASGFANCIDPLEIYLAFEEYFSSEKTASERTESLGITDKEKVENHGFDIKKSFRGKP